MKKLIQSIRKLQRSDVKKQIDKRLKEFKQLGKKSSNEIFKELCFCITTANSTAERCMEVQSKVDDGFLTLPPAGLQKKLKQCSCRFHTKRAGYIIEARKCKDSLKEILKSMTEHEAREWLVENIKGIGFKEASHFLRNIGYDDVAIVDFHIVDVLAKHGMLKKPKTMNKKEYIKIEQVLRKLSEKLKMSLGELDFYLWYLETGKVLK